MIIKILFEQIKTSLFDIFKRPLKTEGSSMLFSMVIVVILVSITIHSFIQITRLVGMYLSNFSNHFFLELIFYFLLSVVCIVVLYFLIKPKSKDQDQMNDLMSSNEEERLSALIVSFAQGLLRGFNSRSHHRSKNKD